MRRLAQFALVLLAAVAWTGCTEHPMTNAAPDPFMGSNIGAPTPAPGAGATAGGVQDMNLARDLVAEGRVPPPEAFSVEGMFSEHDLPLDGPACSDPLCLRAALGIAPDSTGATAAWVQVGLSSSIDLESFDRPSLTLVAAVDVSGSMGASYAGGPTPLELSKSLLRDIVAELGPADQLAIVTYGNIVHTPVPLTPVVDVAALQGHIDLLNPSGSTYMEAGLEEAINVATGAVGQTDEVRILLLSDERPNVGAIDPSAFERMVSTAADSGIGLTLFGAGLGLDAALLETLAGFRGGNAFTLSDPDDVDRIMSDHWPWMFCPIAYDLKLSAIPSRLTLTAAYGLPPTAEDAAAKQLEVKTVFLSRNRGAILLQLSPDPVQGSLVGVGAVLQLDYQTPDGVTVSDSMGVSYGGEPLDAHGQYLPQVGLSRAVALAVLVMELRRSAGYYRSHPAEAIVIVQDALARLTADAAALGDSSLDDELTFTAALLTLMQNGAPQGTFYP